MSSARVKLLSTIIKRPIVKKLKFMSLENFQEERSQGFFFVLLFSSVSFLCASSFCGRRNK